MQAQAKTYSRLFFIALLRPLHNGRERSKFGLRSSPVQEHSEQRRPESRPHSRLCKMLSLMAMTISLFLNGAAVADKVRGKPGSIEVVAPDLVYYASEHDTLTTIAKKFTDKVSHWEAIGKLNQVGNDRAIPIGSKIIIPVALLSEEPMQAVVVALAGSNTETPLKGQERALALGDKLNEGSVISTGKNGFLTLELADATRISLPSNSQVALAKLKMTKFTKSPRTEVKLLQGRVESKVSSLQGNKGRFEVSSKLAMAGVRGTHFRVGVNEHGIANEVLEGGVAVGQIQKPAALTLSSGQGNIVSPSGVGKAIDLLAAPQLADTYQLQQRPTLQFTAMPVAGAATYRAQISKDAQAQDVVAESMANQLDFKFTNIDDGRYFIRVTAIDANGLEGVPGIYPFTLKARPEPPFQLQPKHKVSAEHVLFKWTQTSAAVSYRLQVASDIQFKNIVLEQGDKAALKEAQLSTSALKKGAYFWRVATITETQGSSDQGPYSVPQYFEVIDTPALPEFKDNGAQTLNFAWPGEPGQSFLVQVARDSEFKKLILNKDTDQPNVNLARPESGVYYIRVRTTEADRFRGEFSKPQKFDIEMRWTTSSGDAVQSISGNIKQEH